MRYRCRVTQWHKYKVPWVVEATSLAVEPKWWEFWKSTQPEETHQYVSEIGIIWYKKVGQSMEKVSYGMGSMLENFTRKEELRKKLDDCVCPTDD